MTKDELREALATEEPSLATKIVKTVRREADPTEH